jgi:hypothetical protein
MSIRGIDAQIMIARTAELSRETSTMQTRPEVNQQLLAEQQKAAAAQDAKRVTQLEEPETDGMRTEKDGGGNNSYEGSGEGQSHEELDENHKPGMLVPPSENILDIRI